MSQEDLPGIQPLLFRELDQRIAQTRLEHEPLPDLFLSSESEEQGRALVFRGERYDLNLTLFRSPNPRPGPARGSGVFVVSNGAGVATNTVDQLSRSVPVGGMIDLKRDFVQAKIAAALEMVRAVRGDLDALVVNMISGIALARDTVAALEHFCADVAERVPVVLRFSGPRPDESRAILADFARRHPSAILAISTRDLVEKTAGLFGARPDPTATAARLATRVEEALALRAKLGVTLDPEVWLTPDRTLENVFGDRRQTRVGVLGFGPTAQFQLGAMCEHGARIAWIVTPSAARHDTSGLAGVDLFESVAEAVRVRGDVDVVLNYAPAARALEAVRGCLEGSSRVRLMILVAENMAYEKAIRVMDALEARGVACIGPNSPGVMLVEERGGAADLFKLGNMPPHLFGRPGAISVVGRSGTVIFDIVEKTAAIGTRLGWAIGGDRYTGLGFLEALLMLEQDAHTRFIVLNGEAGGIQEQLAACLLATGVVTKPVIALVTGESLPAGVQSGHQGAVKFAEADDPRAKERHLAAAGAIVVSNPTEVRDVIREIERVGWNLRERRREALWLQFVAAGRVGGPRWSDELQPAYRLLYDLVGHYRIFAAHERTPVHLHEVVTHVAGIGIEPFAQLLATLIRPAAFVTAFEKSREYVAELVRGIREVGRGNFRVLVEDLFGEEAFNQALAATPWAAADLVNEAHEIGVQESQTTVAKTVGVRLFRETLAAQPWNTAHAFRSINNMRWWRYVRAYDRYGTHLTGDSQLAKASWRRNPWASVKLVRGYDRMPEGQLERALDDPDSRALFFEKSRSDPQGLLELGKQAFSESLRTGRPFPEVYGERAREGVPDPPEIDAEIELMGREDFTALVELLFTPRAFARSRELHPNSTARALRAIRELGDARASGTRRLLEIHRAHAEFFDTPSFRLAVERNLWMVVDLLRAASRFDAISLDRIVEYVVGPSRFNHSVAEHQWGTSQAFRKIADMGPRAFLDACRSLEDVTRDRECFGASFQKNPRDAVEIVQVVAGLGEAAFAELMQDAETREAFLTRMRVCPRNAAHFLQEVALMGVAVFNTLAEAELGRPLVNEMLHAHGCSLVRILRRINIVGIEDSRRELRRWRREAGEGALTATNALEVVGIVKERVLERRFADPERRVPVSLPGQPTYRVSEGEIRGLYQSYPEWGDVLFKLHEGESMSPAEAVDVYRLVSGRKRFQTHMVPILTNFLPIQAIRERILGGEPLIPELRALRGVAQGSDHRFDVYFHTLEVLDQLVARVLPLEFVPAKVRHRVHDLLQRKIEGVTRRDLLLLAAALHDVGKAGFGTDESASHAQRGATVARTILARFGLSVSQSALVTDVIRYHVPAKQRRAGERWDDFVERGGLAGLYDQIVDGGRNAHPVETVLHYQADILGRRGDETDPVQAARREQVTRALLERYLREHPGA